MLSFTITETQKIEPVFYDWGELKWVMNGEVAPGCEQSFGLVHILPGKTNPEHWHTAAEEIVFMLEGECDVRLGDRRERDELDRIDLDHAEADPVAAALLDLRSLP